MPYFRYCAISIVGHRLDHQRDAAWTITVASDRFVVHAFFFAGTATNCTVDRIVWHVPGLGVHNRFAQACVAFRIATACACSDRDLFNKLSKQFAALGIERAFLVLDTMPFRMSRHLIRSFWRV